jgi:hypothetical protein
MPYFFQNPKAIPEGGLTTERYYESKDEVRI